MRTPITKTGGRCLATVFLVACPFVSSFPVAKALQSTSSVFVTSSSKSAEAAIDPVLVRNTVVRPDPLPAMITAKEQKGQDKKAMGRCWKRLMTMVREIRHAHTDKKATP